MVEELLGECYRLDVLKNDKQAFQWLLRTPYAQDMREEASAKLSKIMSVNDNQCFITKKYKEYLKLLLK